MVMRQTCVQEPFTGHMKSPVTYLIAVLREPQLRQIPLTEANSLPPCFPVQFALAV